MTASSFYRKLFVAVVLVIVVSGKVGLSDYTSNCTKSVARSPPGVCPTWFVENIDKKRCDCREGPGRSVKCLSNSNSSLLRSSFCMTYNETSKLTYAGSCPYGANRETTLSFFQLLPKDILQLNNHMCDSLNRTGLLCSQCQEGLGPAVLSYRKCLECMDEPNGWILYFFMATFPQTILCLFVIIFRINAASPSLNGFVLAAQIITNVINTNKSSNVNGFPGKFVATCYGFWNLDFFSYVLPSFCIKEGMSTLTVVALEYTVALYPIFFTVVVYYCITLHDNGCRVLVFCWRPFRWCFTRFRETWELKGSVINAFATFLLLSYSKLCSISFSLLQSINVLDICGGSDHRVYFDASYERLSKEHLPYVVLASIVIIIFVCLPALFILFYQNKVFHKCLNFCKFKCVLIHELANICQGCFKNGTSPGTRDYRWFAGLYLLLRILFTATANQNLYQLVMIFVPCTMSVLVALLRPYRTDFYNKLDSVLWILFTMGSSWYVYVLLYGDLSPDWIYIFACLPLVYVFGFVVWRLIAITIRKYRSLIAKRKKTTKATEENYKQENNEDQLPHRLLQPSEYTPLISASQQPNLTIDAQESVQSNQYTY